MSVLELPSDEQLMLWVIDPTPLRDIVMESDGEIAWLLYNFCKSVLRCRWPAEQIIVTNAWVSYLYAFHVMKSPWKDAEKNILCDTMTTYYYIIDVLKTRWVEAEPVLMKSEQYINQYACNILKSRWLEAEDTLKNHAIYYEWYCAFFKIK